MTKYNFHAFLKKLPKDYNETEKAYISSQIEAAGQKIDQGIFKDNPLLLGALGARLVEEAQSRMPRQESDSNEANPNENETPPITKKLGLFE